MSTNRWGGLAIIAVLALAGAGCQSSDSPTLPAVAISVNITSVSGTYVAATSQCPFLVGDVVVTNNGLERVTLSVSDVPAGLVVSFGREVLEPGQGSIMGVDFDCSIIEPIEGTLTLVAEGESGEDQVEITVSIEIG